MALTSPVPFIGTPLNPYRNSSDPTKEQESKQESDSQEVQASAWRPAWPTRWITYSFKNFLTGEGDIKSVGNQGR